LWAATGKHAAQVGFAFASLCALHAWAAEVSPELPRCIELRRPLSLGVEGDMHHLHITELLVLGEAGRRLPLRISGASSQVTRRAHDAVDNDWDTCSHNDYGKDVPYGVEDHWMQVEVSDPYAPFFQIQVHHRHPSRVRLDGVILAIKQDCASDGALAEHVLSSESDIIEWDVTQIAQVQAAALARQLSSMRDIQAKVEDDLLCKVHEIKALDANLEEEKRGKARLADMVKTQKDVDNKLRLELDFETNARSNLTILLNSKRGEVSDLHHQLFLEKIRNTQLSGVLWQHYETIATLSDKLHDAQMQNEHWKLMFKLVALVWTVMLALTFWSMGKHMATSKWTPDAAAHSERIRDEAHGAVEQSDQLSNLWDDSVHPQLRPLHGVEDMAKEAETPPPNSNPSSCDLPRLSDGEEANDVHRDVINGSHDSSEDCEMCTHEQPPTTNAVKEVICCHSDDETDDWEEYEHIQCSEPEVEASWFSVVYRSQHVNDAHIPPMD